MLTVAALYIYPVKSCAGIRCAQATLDARGLRHDRGWMIVDGHDEFVTQREHPRLALITPQLEADALHLSTPEGQAVSVPMTGIVGPTRRVRVWRDWCEAVDQGDAAAQFFPTGWENPSGWSKWQIPLSAGLTRTMQKPRHSPASPMAIRCCSFRRRPWTTSTLGSTHRYP